MRPCMGVDGICPPLCTYQETRDGTYTIADIRRFNLAIDERIYYAEEARQRAREQSH